MLVIDMVSLPFLVSATRDGNDDAFGYGGFFHMTALRLMERTAGEEQKHAAKQPEGKF